MKPESPVMSIEAKPKGGRPISIRDSKRIFVLLDPQMIERARSLGAGNVSAGIRAALSPDTTAQVPDEAQEVV